MKHASVMQIYCLFVWALLLCDLAPDTLDSALSKPFWVCAC